AGRSLRLAGEIWSLASSGFRRDGAAETLAEGVSSGDLAGFEAAVAVLIPAARAAMATASMLEARPRPERLAIVFPEATRSGARYDRLEQLAARIAGATVQAIAGDAIELELYGSSDPR